MLPEESQNVQTIDLMSLKKFTDKTAANYNLQPPERFTQGGIFQKGLNGFNLAKNSYQ